MDFSKDRKENMKQLKRNPSLCLISLPSLTYRPTVRMSVHTNAHTIQLYSFSLFVLHSLILGQYTDCHITLLKLQYPVMYI
jgi:hypothetical protein